MLYVYLGSTSEQEVSLLLEKPVVSDLSWDSSGCWRKRSDKVAVHRGKYGG